MIITPMEEIKAKLNYYKEINYKDKDFFIPVFTKSQQEILESFDKALQDRELLALCQFGKSCEWGRSRVLSEIGFIYQALGYEVVLICDEINYMNYFATAVLNSSIKETFYQENELDQKVILIWEDDTTGEFGVSKYCNKTILRLIKRFNESDYIEDMSMFRRFEK